jgi:hypothetical protein
MSDFVVENCSIKFHAAKPKEKKKMAFSWSGFLVTLAAFAPVIVAGTEQLAGEASTASKTQLATDSLNLATGLGEALTSSDPQDQALAALASQITASVIKSTQAAHAVPATVASVQTTGNLLAAPAAQVSTQAQPAQIAQQQIGKAVQVG